MEMVTAFDFPIGARVVLVSESDWDDEIEFGETGTVLCYLDATTVGVEWDKGTSLRHSLNDDCGCADQHGWYVNPSLIQMLTDEDLDSGKVLDISDVL